MFQHETEILGGGRDVNLRDRMGLPDSVSVSKIGNYA